MRSRQLIALCLIFALLLAGSWLLARPGALAPETAQRQQTVRQVAAPAGAESASQVTSTGDHQYQPIAASPINMADVTGEVAPADSLFQRWLNGEVDLDENEGRLGEAELAALRTAALNLPVSDRVQTSGNGGQAPVPGTSFDSLDYNQSGGFVPPDPELAVGANHVIAVVNVTFEIYNKSGTTVLGPLSFSSFFSGVSGCSGMFDPNVLYDESTGRYILGIDANGDHYCVAVSASSDPTGTWYRYSFATNISGAFFDYPHAGVGRDAIYMGANQFLGSSYLEGRVWAMDKSAMYAGLPMTPVTASTTANGGTPQPLHLHGWQQGTWPASGPHYFITDPYDGGTLQLWSWSNAISGGTPGIVATLNLNAATGVTGGMPVDTPQSGGGTVQANDWRFRSMEYRNGSAWVSDSISCNPGGGTVNCVRWAEIDLASRTIVQAGVYASSGSYRIFADLVANHCEDMAIGYTKSSSSMYPSVWYTGRLHTEPLGTLQSEAQLKAGEITYVAFDGAPYRWGDYSGMTIDPNGLTFWYLGEYSKNTGTSNGRWGNYIGSFTYPSCTITPPPTDYFVHLPYMVHEEPPPPPVNVLVNGNFEQGPGVGWGEYSTHGWPLVMSTAQLPTSVPPHSGSWAVWLGGDYDEVAYIYQQATVPASNPLLTFYYWIDSEDFCGYDFGGVIINNAVVVDLFDLCTSTNTGGWVARTVNLGAYANQSINIQIRAETDNSLNSNLFVDDVALGLTLLDMASPAGSGAASDAAAKAGVLGEAARGAGTTPAGRFWLPTGTAK